MNLTEAVQQYRVARSNLDYAKQVLEKAESDLLNTMAEGQHKSFTINQGDRQSKVTYVQTETVRVNEAGLRKALGARTFNKYTVRKVDKTKLEDGIARGELDGNIVSEYCEIKKSKPYIRYTEGAVSEPDDQPS